MTIDKLIIKESLEMLEDLEDYSEDMNGWEQSFIESLSEQLEQKKQISSKQYNKLKDLHCKFID